MLVLLSAIPILKEQPSTRIDVNVSQKTTPPASTDALQTLPPIIASGPNAVAGCTLLNVVPGSIVTGTTGFVRANCPNTSAMLFGQATETPTFILATGFQQIVLMANSDPCGFIFKVTIPSGFNIHGFQTIGVNLTSSGPITFTNNFMNSTDLSTGGYDYCLYYSNVPSTGVASFTIAWSP